MVAIPSALTDLPGVHHVVFGTAAGGVVAQAAEACDAETVAAVCAALGQTLGRLGSTLRLGDLQGASVRGGRGAWVMRYDGDQCAAIEVDAAQPTGPVETALRTVAWRVTPVESEALAEEVDV